MARAPKTDASRQMAEAVGREIRKRRLVAGLSQEGLADAVGVHRTQIGFLERGENTTSVYTLSIIADALGTKASEVLQAIGR